MYVNVCGGGEGGGPWWRGGSLGEFLAATKIQKLNYLLDYRTPATPCDDRPPATPQPQLWMSRHAEPQNKALQLDTLHDSV